MKVAHINCLVSKRGLLGVEKKLSLQARAAEELGLPVDVYYFGIARLHPNEKVLYQNQGHVRLTQSLSVLHRYSRVPSRLDIDAYDLLVLRYSGADFSLFSKLFRRYAKKLVTEHHTKELPEAHTYETTIPQKMLTLFMERFLGPRMIRGCAGLIAVTDEIRAYEAARAGAPIEACTIPNGVLVEEIPFSGHAPYDGRELNVLCLANRFEAWQGLDRMLLGLGNYDSGRPRVNLLVVGSVSPEDLQRAEPLKGHPAVGVKFLGRRYGAELEALFRKSHVAVTSLAMFRKGMQEACALKTREYMARGLPFVIGHHDPDLSGAGEFLLSVSPDDNPVDLDEVVAFAQRVLKDPDVAPAMREFAQNRLDWKIKMQQMWDFLKSLRGHSDPIPRKIGI